MIPILYAKTETSFTSNGLGRLTDCLSCTVTEERNGIFECEFDYPITGKFYQQMITDGGIIGVIHDDNHDVQPFDIYAFTAPISGVVTFHAHHISYRLNHIMLRPFTASSCAEVMVKIPQTSVNTNPFTFLTDKTVAASFALETPNSVRGILGGSAGSILDVFGTGEYKFDKWSVHLLRNRGKDTKLTIRYGKNLTDVTYDKDSSGTYNAIAPFWKDADGNVVYLPEIYVLSPDAPTDHVPWTNENGVHITDENGVDIEFELITDSPMAVDFSGQFADKPTVQELRDRALQYLSANQPWIPKENITVDFTQLWQTPEYAQYAALQRVALCDTVSVYYPELGVIAEEQKVIRVVYNVLLERFDEMELGEPQTSLAEQIETATETITDQKIADFGSVMQAAIDRATELITGGLGGYVVFTMNADGQPQEILIMDTDSVDTAVNVIRMNRNGIGFSTTGYAGPYTSAWTIDGAFNADFITAGTINANLIRAGILSDYVGNNFWNLLTGALTLSGDLTMQGDHGDSRMGTVQVQYLDFDTVPYTLHTVDRAGLEILSEDGNKAMLAANYDDGTSIWKKGSILYAESDGGNTGVPNEHERVYKSTRNGVQYLAEETVSSSWSWLVWDLDANDLATHMILKSGGLEQRMHRNGSIYTFFDASLTRFLWRTEDGSNDVGINVTKNDIVIGKLSTTPTSPLISADANGIRIYARNGRYITTGTSTQLSYCGTYVQLQGSSSRRYKHEIDDLTDPALDPHRLLLLPVRQFVYDNNAKVQYDDMHGKVLPGFIAEEVEELYPAAVIRHDGEVENWDERRIIPAMLSLIQEQQKRIDDLEARLEKLERLVMQK